MNSRYPTLRGLHEEAIQLVKRALESLSREEQTLLRLKLSIEQIAQLYQIKISAVKMRLKRSKVKIEQFYHRPQAR